MKRCLDRVGAWVPLERAVDRMTRAVTRARVTVGTTGTARLGVIDLGERKLTVLTRVFPARVGW